MARDYDATLVPVLAWLPPCGDLADRRTPNEELRRIWAQDAHQQLQDTLNLAWGTLPFGLLVLPLARRGQPLAVLPGAACDPPPPPRARRTGGRRGRQPARTPDRGQPC